MSIHLFHGNLINTVQGALTHGIVLMYSDLVMYLYCTSFPYFIPPPQKKIENHTDWHLDPWQGFKDNPWQVPKTLVCFPFTEATSCWYASNSSSEESSDSKSWKDTHASRNACNEFATFQKLCYIHTLIPIEIYQQPIKTHGSLHGRKILYTVHDSVDVDYISQINLTSDMMTLYG